MVAPGRHPAILTHELSPQGLNAETGNKNFWRFVFSKLIADKEIRPTGKQNFHMRTHIHMHIIDIHRHTDTCT